MLGPGTPAGSRGHGWREWEKRFSHAACALLGRRTGLAEWRMLLGPWREIDDPGGEEVCHETSGGWLEVQKKDLQHGCHAEGLAHRWDPTTRPSARAPVMLTLSRGATPLQKNKNTHCPTDPSRWIFCILHGCVEIFFPNAPSPMSSVRHQMSRCKCRICISVHLPFSSNSMGNRTIFV